MVEIRTFVEDACTTAGIGREDCLKVLDGQLDGPGVFMSGRVQVTGDLGLAIQLKALFPSVA